MTTSQDSSTSQAPGTQRQLDLSTAERSMSLHDNCSNSNTEPNSVNTTADLLQQLKGSESNIMKLLVENQALKEVQRELKSKLKSMERMSLIKEDVLREREKVIAIIHSEKTALVDRNDDLMAKLRTAQNQILDCKTACNLRVDYLEGLVWKGQSENSLCSKRTKELESLVEATEKKWLNVQEDLQNNVELTEKLRTAETQFRDGKTAIIRKVEFIEGLVLRFSVCSKRNKELESLVKTSDLKVNTLQDQLRSEQVEKETYLQRTKELESLVEATEKKWLNVQEDLQNNVELTEKLRTAETQFRDGKTAIIRKVEFIEGLVLRFSVCSKRIKELESLVETSDLKVNTLQDHLRSEQVEKETCLQRTKELESLVEATEKKCLNLQEDSQHKVLKMEEDIKSLIVKSIKLQELALMSDSDKARRSEEERKVQKKQEKTEKLQREMKLKEREKQEKKKQQKIAKELIEKLKGRKSMRR